MIPHFSPGSQNHQSSETDVSTQGSPETSTAATTTSASPPDEVPSPPLRRSQCIRAPIDRYRYSYILPTENWFNRICGPIWSQYHNSMIFLVWGSHDLCARLACNLSASQCDAALKSQCPAQQGKRVVP